MIQLLKSKKFALFSALGIILMQTPITASVIAQYGTGDWLYQMAVVKAIALEASVLYFALNNRKWETTIAMIFVTLINLKYYGIALDNLDMIGVVLSIAPTLLVLLISHQASDYKPKATVNKKFVPLHLREQSKPVATPKVNATPKAELKQKAIMRVQQGESMSSVAKDMDINKSTVSRWVAAL